MEPGQYFKCYNFFQGTVWNTGSWWILRQFWHNPVCYTFGGFDEFLIINDEVCNIGCMSIQILLSAVETCLDYLHKQKVDCCGSCEHVWLVYVPHSILLMLEYA